MEKTDLLKDKRILVVDDEKDVLESLLELMQEYDVDTASSFEEARKKLESSGYDIAVLDIMGVNGYGLLEIAAKKKMVAVMLTANALSPGDTLKSHKKGAAYYLPKQEMFNIVKHLQDVLKAVKEGKNTWWGWFDKFASFYEKKFGDDWQRDEKDYWDKFKNYY